MQWIDRSGHATLPISSGAVSTTVKISPDGRRFAETIFDPRLSSADIWIQDIGRAARVRFTFGPASAEDPVWSPDGKWLAFSANRNGNLQITQFYYGAVQPSMGAEGTPDGQSPGRVVWKEATR